MKERFPSTYHNHYLSGCFITAWAAIKLDHRFFSLCDSSLSDSTLFTYTSLPSSLSIIISVWFILISFEMSCSSLEACYSSLWESLWCWQKIWVFSWGQEFVKIFGLEWEFWVWVDFTCFGNKFQFSCRLIRGLILKSFSFTRTLQRIHQSVQQWNGYQVLPFF